MRRFCSPRALGTLLKTANAYVCRSRVVPNPVDSGSLFPSSPPTSFFVRAVRLSQPSASAETGLCVHQGQFTSGGADDDARMIAFGRTPIPSLPDQIQQSSNLLDTQNAQTLAFQGQGRRGLTRIYGDTTQYTNVSWSKHGLSKLGCSYTADGLVWPRRLDAE